MAKLAYIYHELFEKHDPGSGHPESPRRVQSIQNHLQKTGFLNKVEVFSSPAVSREHLQRVHLPEYIDFVLEKSGVRQAVLDTGDTVINEYSVDAALHAAGAAVKAVDLIFKESFDKIFAAVRPPGHHAERSGAMGFCIFNNIAVAARYAQTYENVNKVLIIDWDVHHGNGTQQAFYNDPDVLYFSIHRSPFYPGSGREDETGEGEGKGFNLNYPIRMGLGDTEYIQLLEDGLARAEKLMKPDLILISAGFDAHEADPLGGMFVTDRGYYKLTEMIARFAQKHCQGRVISFLEGGYNLDALSSSVAKHLQCLLKH